MLKIRLSSSRDREMIVIATAIKAQFFYFDSPAPTTSSEPRYNYSFASN